MGVCLWNLELYIIWGYAYGRFWLLYKNNAQKCTEKWAYLKNGLSYSLVAWRGCYYQQSPPIATFTYAKGWKEKFKHVNIFKSTVRVEYLVLVEASHDDGPQKTGVTTLLLRRPRTTVQCLQKKLIN